MNTNVGQQLLNVPFADMITSMASAIARSQAALDLESIEILRQMCDKEATPVTLPYLQLKNGSIEDKAITTSMVGAGFQPTFYQFAESVIEVKMAITVQSSNETTKDYSGEEKTATISPLSRNGRGLLGRSISITSTPVDATYVNKYSFDQTGSSTLRTRLVPVPPNTFIQQQLDMRAQAIQMEYELQLRQYELALAQKRAELDAELDKLEEEAAK